MLGIGIARNQKLKKSKKQKLYCKVQRNKSIIDKIKLIAFTLALTTLRKMFMRL
jgi:hypothetical protein